MKRIILALSILALAFTAEGQTVYLPNGAGGIGTSSDDNVGIGTSSPQAKFNINTLGFSFTANSTYTTASSRGDIVQLIESNNNGIEIGNAKGLNDRKVWILGRHNDLNYITLGTFYSTLHLQPDVGNKNNYQGVAIGYPANTSLTNGTHLAVNGNVGIGTANPQYKLDVKGQIRATEVLVQSVDQFADFVFDKDYRLPSLHEVDTFIQDNGHLPGIPSAQEVKENGMNLVEMQVKLLQKVEELTLYSIKQQEEIKALKAKLEKLEKK
jgi:hypothetical protein